MFMKTWKVLLCASLSIAPSALDARQHARRVSAITVTAAPNSIPQWTARIGHDLDSHIVYPVHMGTDAYPEGAVRVQFRCDDAGLPTAIRLVQSSHSRSLDRAALRAVSGIATLHPLPDGVTHDRPMEAWILFAADDQKAAGLKANLQRRAQLAAAGTPAQGEQLALQQPLVIASR